MKPVTRSLQGLGFRFDDGGESLIEPAARSGSDSIDIGQILATLRRRRWTILFPVLVCVMLGVVYLLTTPKVYRAYSTLLLDAGMNRNVQLAGGLETLTQTDEAVENARVVIQSDGLSAGVVDTLNLTQDPRFMDPPTSLLSRLVGTARQGVRDAFTFMGASLGLPPGNQFSAAVNGTTDPARLEATRALQGNVDVSRVSRSAALLIRYESHDPVLAATVANRFADAYVEDMLRTNFEATERTTSWMQARVQQLQEQAQEAANRVERFRVENGIVSAGDGALLSDNSLTELNSSLTAAISEAARARATVETYQAAVERGPEALMSGANLAVSGGEISRGYQQQPSPLQQQQDRVNDVRARLDRLIGSYGEDHPQVAGLRETLRSAANRLYLELQVQLAEARNNVAMAEARVAALQDSLSQTVQASNEQGGAQVQLRALERQAETLSQLYQSMLMRAQEVEQQQSFPVANARVLSYAEIPDDAAGPSKPRVLAGAVILGLMLGLVRAVSLEMGERPLRTATDVSSVPGLRFLGYLPRLPARLTRRDQASGAVPAAPARVEPQVTSHHHLPAVRRLNGPAIHVGIPALRLRRSSYAEALRHVRLAAENAADGRGAIALGVASPLPSVHRAAVTLNLAGILSGGRRRVLLIDADTRLHRLSHLLGIEGLHGLTDALAGQGEWQDMTVTIAMTSIDALAAGRAGTSPEGSDLIHTHVIAQMIEEARDTYDFILVDLAPLSPVVDGRAVVPALDHFVMIAEWGRTTRSMLESLVASDPDTMQHCLGVVLDQVDPRWAARAFKQQRG